LKRFSKELVHGFSITETTARVAIVTYSDEPKVNKDLGSGQSFRMVVNNIDDIKLSNKPNRNLEEALRFTNENIFSLKGGLRKVCIKTIHKGIINVYFISILVIFEVPHLFVKVPKHFTICMVRKPF
jgi:hypothetical protein